SLLLERYTQLGVAGLQLLEQAHVLDGDGGLIGEGLEELDLRSCELSHFHTADSNGADRSALANHLDRQRASKPCTHKQSKVFGVIACVGNVLCPAFEDRACHRRSTTRRHWVEPRKGVSLF